MNDPWAFGWTQLLTIVGFTITICIAIGGFRTFSRWKREKIEEHRINVALEALALAYQSQGVFDAIRNPGSFPYEWQDMPRGEGESDEDYEHRKTYYVPLKRLDDNKDFFMRAWQLQPRMMALFGPGAEELFKSLHAARVYVIVAARMLMRRERGDWSEEKMRRRTQLEADIWSGYGDVYDKDELPEGDRVQKKLDEFKDGVIEICRPIVDREFNRNERARGILTILSPSG
jgi:hypothetical protein